MLKQLLSLFLFLILIEADAQSKLSVRLKWKIPPDDTLMYQTVMEEMDSSTFRFNNGLAQDRPGRVDSITEMYAENLRRVKNQFNYVSKLSNGGADIINVVMIAVPNDSTPKAESNKQQDMLNAMQKIGRGVALRGSVYASGGLHSFWIINRQRNLLSLLFELPTKSVRAGDTWSLDVHLISNDQNFMCDSSRRVNEVRLVKLEIGKGDTVALIRYNIEEFVSGSFGSLFSETRQSMSMHITHTAEARFSINAGRWLSYDGIMELDATGMMDSHQKTRFSLVKQ